ncbi:MAG: hypothetical protein WKF96_19665 [Solirubrobacteraceae bacterium]
MSRPSIRTVALRAALFGAATAACGVSPAQALGAFDAKVYGSTTNVRPGVALPTGASSGASLAAARNEFESFQVVVQASEGRIAGLSVRPGATLTGPGGATIPIGEREVGTRMTIYREGTYEVPAEPGRSDLEGALGTWTDALIPEVDPIYGEDRNAWPRDVPAGGTEIAWVDVHVPAGQAPGMYTGSVVVKDGEALLDTIPVTLEVRPFTLPSTSSLDNAFFVNFNQPCLAHVKGSLCSGDTDEAWRLQSLYARAALENRVTISNPWMYGLDEAPNTEVKKQLFRRHVLPLLDGSGGSAGSRAPRLADARLTQISQYWQCTAICLQDWRAFLQNPRGVADPPAGDDLRRRFVYYACDEPPGGGTCTYQQARDRMALAQAAFPGVTRLVTTTPQRKASEGIAADLLVTQVNQLDGKPNGVYPGNQRFTQDYRDHLDPAKDQAGTATNRLWMYTSDGSHGSNRPCPQADPDAPAGSCAQFATNSVSPLWQGWPGYVIDQPAAQSRAVSWLAFNYDVSGELYYRVDQRLQSAWTSSYDFGGHGDGTLFYPGTTARIGGATDIPVESIRLKRIREGREDYEYLQRAAAAGRGVEAKQVIAGVFGTSEPMDDVTDAIRDASFGAARAQLAGYITGDAPPTRTCADPPTVTGTPGSDPNLRGTPGDDVIHGLGGDDVIHGLGGNDVICAGEGFDTLDGGPGDDRLDGQGGGDGVEYGFAPRGVAADLATGVATGDGTDVLISVTELYGSPFDDQLTGSSTNGATLEYLAGGAGQDTLDGGDGRDWVSGGPGDDRVDGGPGVDRIDGGAGADSLSARDATADERVDCGIDTDLLAVVDPADPVIDCEAVEDGIDRAAPETSITSGTADGSRSETTDATFAFTASEPGSRFECSVDTAAFVSCASPVAFPGLAVGNHSFAVRAIDPAGNVDASPARRIWAVTAAVAPPPPPDRRAPETSIVRGPPGVVSTGDALLEFSADEPARFECRSGSEAFVACTSPRRLTGLADGEQSFSVRAIDAAGNVDATPEVRTWTVRRPRPRLSCTVSAASQSLKVALTRGVLVGLRCSERARATLRLTVPRRVAFAKRLVRTRRGNAVTIGTAATDRRFGAVRVRLTTAARRSLGFRSSVRATLMLAARTADGRSTTRRKIVLLQSPRR